MNRVGRREDGLKGVKPNGNGAEMMGKGLRCGAG